MPKVSNSDYEAHLQRLAELEAPLWPQYYQDRIYGLEDNWPELEDEEKIENYKDECTYLKNIHSRISETKFKIEPEKAAFKDIEEYVNKLDNTPSILYLDISNALEKVFDADDHHFINHKKNIDDKNEYEFYIRLSVETKLLINKLKDLLSLDNESQQDLERRKYFILYNQLSQLLLNLNTNATKHANNKYLTELHHKLKALEQNHNLCFGRYLAIEQAAILPAADKDLDKLTDELCNTMLNKARSYSTNPAYQGTAFDTTRNLILTVEQDLKQNVSAIDKFKFSKVLEATTQIFEPKNNLTDIAPAQKLFALSNSLPRKYKTQQVLLGLTAFLLITTAIAIAALSFGAGAPLSALEIAAAISLLTCTGSTGIASSITLGFLNKRTATTQSQKVIDSSTDLTQKPNRWYKAWHCG